MDHTVKIALAQLDLAVGDIAGNIARVREARAEAGDADLVVFPELVVSGYPPEDLVLKPAFQEAIERAVAEYAGETADGGPAVIIGTRDIDSTPPPMA